MKQCDCGEENLSRREREKLAHREEIMSAATRVFAQKGFFQATLDEVAQEAEFSKGALYLYFASKEELLYSVLKEKVLNLSLAMVKDKLRSERSFHEEIRDYFRRNAQVSFEQRDLFAVLIRQHMGGFKALSPQNAEEFRSFHREIDQVTIEYILQAQARGEIRDTEAEGVYGIIHGSLENMLITRWNSENIEQLYKKVDCFLDILFNGIGQQKEK